MTDDNESSTIDEGPSLDDFETPQEEEPTGARSLLGRALRLVLVLLLIAALLVYFVTPFNNFFIGATSHWLRPDMRIRTIPIAPRRATSPTLPV